MGGVADNLAGAVGSLLCALLELGELGGRYVQNCGGVAGRGGGIQFSGGVADPIADDGEIVLGFPQVRRPECVAGGGSSRHDGNGGGLRRHRTLLFVAGRSAAHRRPCAARGITETFCGATGASSVAPRVDRLADRQT